MILTSNICDQLTEMEKKAQWKIMDIIVPVKQTGNL